MDIYNEVNFIDYYIEENDLASLASLLNERNIHSIFDNNVETILSLERKEILDYIVSNNIHNRTFSIKRCSNLSMEMEQYIHDKRYLDYSNHEQWKYCSYCDRYKNTITRDQWVMESEIYDNYIQWLPLEALDMLSEYMVR